LSERGILKLTERYSFALSTGMFDRRRRGSWCKSANTCKITIRWYLSLIPSCMDRVIEGVPNPHITINKA